MSNLSTQGYFIFFVFESVPLNPFYSRNKTHAISNAFKSGRRFPNSKRSEPRKLAHCKFSVKQWNAAQKKHQKIRNEKHSSSILIRQIRKSPNISETNTVTYAGEHELQVTTP